jgi:ornithine cyclodeaminase/alanine dehydrogenase-like protein (mu-crystallin family)
LSATLLLTAADVRALLPLRDCIGAVEAGFRRQAEGLSPQGVLGIHVGAGGFHVKAAALQLERHYFVAKLNGNFPENPARNGLPTIQGVVALCDAENGRLLALLDSSEITRLRTGAATAVAAKYLARPDSATLTLFGCGRQGRAQVESLVQILPLTRVYLHDLVPQAADALADWITVRLGIDAVAMAAAGALTRAGESDVIVTCTPSRRFFLTRAMVRPGTFVAGVGADDAGKQELEPELLAASRLVADVLEQCATIGDFHHALAAGVMRREQVHAELADVVAGRKPGRVDREEITVFDSTGTALEDAAAAAMTYERALAQGRGVSVCLAGEFNATEEAI